MKNTYFENNPLTEDELKSLWSSAIFVFDSNILLNFYRYSDETSKDFLDTITKLGERVWIPYQVGLEFHRNRLTTITEQKDNYEDFKKKINEIIDAVENKNRSPFLSKTLFEKLISIKNEINTEVEHKIQLFDRQLNHDSILEKINTVFDKKIGNPSIEEEIKQIFIDGKERYEKDIPPGYMDKKKPEDRRYGDLIIWKQLLSKAKTEQVDIILIIDDRKEDWWLNHQGKTISPRPELLKEFRIETSKMCHFYKPFQFLKYSNQYLGSEIKPEVIEEVKNYKTTVNQEQETILLQWLLKGNPQDISLLVHDLEREGYDINNVYYSSSNIFVLNITLPNIPDLIRRLNHKYQPIIANKGIEFIESEILHQAVEQ